MKDRNDDGFVVVLWARNSVMPFFDGIVRFHIASDIFQTVVCKPPRVLKPLAISTNEVSLVK